jgi:outer membrane protein assembly factor BamE (lipoprotein component of BamABCDE complex)
MAFAPEMARHPAPVNSSRRVRRPAAVLALVLALGGGCSYVPLFDAPRVARGNAPEPEQLSQIVPGVQTRADVAALLGSPSASSTFSDEEWYYISGTTRIRPGQNLALEDQRVVAIRFDASGHVQQVRELNQADAREVQVVQRETPVPGNDRTFLQALFGNIGRVGPGVGATQPGMPGPQ